jgi:hypothetical protein
MTVEAVPLEDIEDMILHFLGGGARGDQARGGKKKSGL